MLEVSGVNFDYRRKDAAMLVEVGIDTLFRPFNLWQLQESLRKRRVYAEVRIDNGRLRLELPHIGIASEALRHFIAGQFEETLFGDEADAQARMPVEPITVFRKTGEVALDPLAPITTRQLSYYMAHLSHKHDFDGSWSGVLAGSWRRNLVGCDYLCVSFDTPGIAIDIFPEAFNTSFAGSCAVSIQAYDVQPGTLLFSLEYGGSFPLNLAQAEALGFSGVQKRPGTPHIVLTVVRQAVHQDAKKAHEQNLWNAILFAQALGCHPVGEIVILWDDYNSSTRKLGPMSNEIRTVLPSK